MIFKFILKAQRQKKLRSLNLRIRRSDKYAIWRNRILNRDKWKCQNCNSTYRPEVHHIKPFVEILKEKKILSLKKALKCKELWKLENGVTLCHECHKLTTNYRKG